MEVGSVNKKKGSVFCSFSNLVDKLSDKTEAIRGPRSTASALPKRSNFGNYSCALAAEKREDKRSGATCLTKLCGGTASPPPLPLSRATDALLAIG